MYFTLYNFNVIKKTLDCRYYLRKDPVFEVSMRNDINKYI